MLQSALGCDRGRRSATRVWTLEYCCSFQVSFGLCLVLQFFESGQNSVCAGIYAYRRDVAPVNDAIRINYKQRPFAGAVAFPIHTEKSGHGSLRFEVGEQREMQLAIPAESRMTPGTVNGDTKQFRPQLPELRENLIVKPHLVATNG